MVTVKRWTDSPQRRRYPDAALLDIMPRLDKAKRAAYLTLLRHALPQELEITKEALPAQHEEPSLSRQRDLT